MVRFARVDGMRLTIIGLRAQGFLDYYGQKLINPSRRPEGGPGVDEEG
jgi:hypothetical protein